ncbi:hypothetical protein JOM56_013747 [Amanita muscaria]
MSTSSLQHPTGNDLDHARRRNQHLPIPPRNELRRWIQYYWHLGFTDPKIAEHVMDHFDREKYGCSAKSVQRLRKELDLKGTIRQAASFETLEKFRFVDSALAMEPHDSGTRGRRWKNVFLIEEVIHGDEEGPFRKYLNNVSPVPLPMSCKEDDERATFLSFSQHVQYWKMKKQAFVSDYQGGNSLLTDPQISSSPFLGPIFADGNIASIHRNFEQEHECNYFCIWFNVPTDYNTSEYGVNL